jgi:hypothetical protein
VRLINNADIQKTKLDQDIQIAAIIYGLRHEEYKTVLSLIRAEKFKNLERIEE